MAEAPTEEPSKVESRDRLHREIGSVREYLIPSMFGILPRYRAQHLQQGSGERRHEKADSCSANELMHKKSQQQLWPWRKFGDKRHVFHIFANANSYFISIACGKLVSLVR